MRPPLNRPTQKRRAGIRKLLTVLSVLVAVVTLPQGIIQLVQFVRGPSLGGTIQTIYAPATSESDALVTLITIRQRVLNYIKDGHQKGLSDNQILKGIEDDLNSRPVTADQERQLGVEVTAGTMMYSFVIWNHGGQVARNVQLVLAGQGRAQISEWPQFDPRALMFQTNAPFIEWKHSIPIGDLPAKGVRAVRVWANYFYASFDPSVPQVTFDNGVASFWQVRNFWGPLADIAAWIDSTIGANNFYPAFFTSILVAIILPWISRHKRRSDRSRPESIHRPNQ
jgi:hypothetical protein